MNIKNKIQQLKKLGVLQNEIANATGYSSGYVSKVYREHIDPAPKFRSSLNTFILEKTRPSNVVEPLPNVATELLKLVYDLENKINDLDNIINETKSRINEIKTIVDKQG
jgi:predicted transcriptional regulator